MCRETMKVWLQAAAVNAIRAVAQTAVATIGTAAVLKNIDWLLVLSASVLSGLVSVLTSLAGLPKCKKTEAPKETQAEGENGGKE